MHNYKLWSVFNRLFGVLLSVMLFSTSSLAVVNIEGTRVIFNAGDNAVSVSLSNSEKQPTLVQMWVDEGDMTVSPEHIKTPIIVTSPVFSMKPNEIRSVRLILSSRSSLPKDKESLYWLNIYQIPPTTESSAKLERKVILPLRIRIKIYIRPEGVKAIQQQDGYQLKFKVRQEGDKAILFVTNPTPWHINLNQIEISGEKIPNIMLLPNSDYSMPLQHRSDNYHQINYSIINDQGNNWQYEGKL